MSNNPEDWPIYELTSVDELIVLAAFLFVHAEISPVISHVGIHGDLTEEEEALIKQTISAFAEDTFEGLRDPLLMQLSMTLCRWVAGGRIADPTSDEAREFLDDRYFDRSGGQWGINTKNVWAEEVMWVARDLKANPVFWEAIEKAGEMGEIDQDYWRQVLRPISEKLRIKYGLINRRSFDPDSVLRQISADNIRDLDDPAALEYIKYSNILSIRDEGQN